MSAERVREYMLSHGIRYETHDHDRAVRTSRVAEEEHLPGKAMAKPVILLADGRFVMAVVPGDARVDLNKARAVLSCDELRLATEDEFAPAFSDCETGAEPPLGAMYGMHSLIDLTLTAPKVTFRGGNHEQTITVDHDDYVKLAGGDLVDIVLESAALM